jgi:hypoxanthine-DNA glycosylase
LILSSFPGEASLGRRSSITRIRATTSGPSSAPCWTSRSRASYAQRLARVRGAGIAIWDTIVACERAGSLDAAIRNAERGEIARVRRVARGLRAVAFNGNTAARAAPAWRDAGYATLRLPSTSPAYTLPVAEKRAAWRWNCGSGSTARARLKPPARFTRL